MHDKKKNPPKSKPSQIQSSLVQGISMQKNALGPKKNHKLRKR